MIDSEEARRAYWTGKFEDAWRFMFESILPYPEQEIDRGAPYIEMSERTPMDSPFVSEQARRNRCDISPIMLRHGFVAYPWEFWHYSSGDAYDQFLRATGKPAIYGAVDWDPATNTVRTIAPADQALNSDDEVRREIAAALQRLRAA